MSKLIEFKQERANITAQIRAVMDEAETREMDGTKKEFLWRQVNHYDKMASTSVTALAVSLFSMNRYLAGGIPVFANGEQKLTGQIKFEYC
jgi:hypothetical protein